MTTADEEFLRLAITVAGRARENGNHPFGAVLVDEDGVVVAEAENTVVTGRDCTGHAETNLMRKASRLLDAEQLAKCTLYSSTEPCVMCAGAIFWGNVGRIVYGLSAARFYQLVGETKERGTVILACRDVFAQGQSRVEVIGPLLEEEAQRVHEGFWR